MALNITVIYTTGHNVNREAAVPGSVFLKKWRKHGIERPIPQNVLDLLADFKKRNR